MHSPGQLVSLLVMGLFLWACGGGGEGDTPVADLSDLELEQICEQFHDDICQTTLENVCTSSCRATCKSAEAIALMRQQCIAPITVAQVNECGQLFGNEDETAYTVCTMGGGCVFDVFDETCR